MKEHEGPHTAAGDRQHVEELIERQHQGLAGQLHHLEVLIKQFDDHAGNRHGDLFAAIMNLENLIANLTTQHVLTLRIWRWQVARFTWDKRA